MGNLLLAGIAVLALMASLVMGRGWVGATWPEPSVLAFIGATFLGGGILIERLPIAALRRQVATPAEEADAV